MQDRSPPARPARWPRQVLAAVAVSFLFCGFPLLLCDAAWHYLWEVRREALERDQFARLQAEVIRLQAMTDPETVIPQSLRRLAGRAARVSQPLPWLQKRLASMRRRFPGLFSFLLYDRSGQVVWKSSRAESSTLARRFLARLRDLDEGRCKRLDFQANPALAFLLGSRPTNHRLQNIAPGWTEISRFSRKTWLFTHLGASFSLVAMVSRQGFSPALPIREVLRRPPRDGVFLNLLDMYSMTMEGHGDADFRRQAIQVMMRSEMESSPQARTAGRLWAQGLIDSRFRVLASVPDRISDLPAVNRNLFRLFAAGFFVLVTLLVWGFRRLEPPPWISLRWKLATLFGFASFLPLVVMLALLSAYLREREDLLVHQTRQSSERLLDSLDGQMVRVFRLCESRLQTILKGPDLVRPGGLERLQRDLTAFRARFRAREITLIDREGAAWVTREPGLPAHDAGRFRKMLNDLLLGILSRHRGDSGPREQKILARSEMLISMVFGRDPQEVFESLVDALGTMQRFQVGNQFLVLYYNLVHLGGALPDRILGVSWEVDDMIRLYLSRFLPFKPLDDGTEVFAVNLDANVRTHVERMPPAAPGGPPRFRRWRQISYVMYPPKPVQRDFRKFFRTFLVHRMPSHRLIAYKGQDYLLSALPGSRLHGFGFFALRPYAPVRDKVAALRRTILGFSVLIVGFTILLGQLLGRKFLEPVREVALGVEAVRREAFRYRIPVLDRDELGDLAALFNRMTESLGELSMGRQVQERLLPHRPLTVGDFTVAGASLPATQLAGDYFDYLPYGPNGILVLQGDVTGHGVPAALVMAMAKAIATEAAARLDPPAEVMAALNRVIHHGGGQSLVMTLGALFLDVPSATATFFNCGNPFPWRFRPGHPPDTVRAVSMPIGMRPVYKGTPLTLGFAPGERWVFSSDGLYETLATPEANGFDRLGEFLAPRMRFPPEEACRRVLAEHPAVLGGAARPDDFTILVVERARG